MVEQGLWSSHVDIIRVGRAFRVDSASFVLNLVEGAIVAVLDRYQQLDRQFEEALVFWMEHLPDMLRWWKEHGTEEWAYPVSIDAVRSIVDKARGTGMASRPSVRHRGMGHGIDARTGGSLNGKTTTPARIDNSSREEAVRSWAMLILQSNVAECIKTAMETCRSGLQNAWTHLQKEYQRRVSVAETEDDNASHPSVEEA